MKMVKGLAIEGTPSKLVLIYRTRIWDQNGQVVVGTLKVILLAIVVLAGIATWRAGVI